MAEMLAQDLCDLCDTFKTLCAQSYDILAEIWKVDPARKFEPNLNSLGAISQANGLGTKLSHGAQAPRDWQAGRYAQVIEYCLDDVWKTKALFERISRGEPILRGDGQPIKLRLPVVQDGTESSPYEMGFRAGASAERAYMARRLWAALGEHPLKNSDLLEIILRVEALHNTPPLPSKCTQGGHRC